MKGNRKTPDGSAPTARVPALAAGAATTRTQREAVSAVIADVLARRSRGEILPDSAVIAAHPSLNPELEAELRALHEMHRIFLAARKAGPMSDTQILPQTASDAGIPTATAFDGARGVAVQGYTILHEISSGGQGTVYRATQDATGRAVAIKAIPGGLLTGSRHRARFDREAAILAKLDHPNIVGILDRGRTADGSLFLVMPFIDGYTLDVHLQHFSRAGKYDIAHVLRLFVQIAQAVAEAHRQGIVHRDLKPANIRVDPRGSPHILDFGLARPQNAVGDTDRMRDITQTGQIVGSLPWTSPEQVSHTNPDGVDSRTDVYALGVMLYQSLTEEFPYSVLGSVREVLNNIANAVPISPSRTKQGAARHIDARLDTIVLRALAKAPRDRYASAQDLADDLDRFLAGKPLATPVRLIARHYRKPAAIALAIVLSIVAGGVVWKLSMPAQVRVIELPSLTNSIGMRLVRIPRGEFLAGSPPKEIGRNVAERQQLVHIDRDFYIGTTEVTQKQYIAVMERPPALQDDPGDDLPVQSVTWDEAVEFCRRLSDREHRHYRLPKEVEWEYACRADSSSSPFGGTRDLPSMGWYKGNSGGHVHRVAAMQPNNWGLYDMHGNASEWCEDVYFRSSDPSDDPGERTSSTRSRHVVRGGGAQSQEIECRSAARNGKFSDQCSRDTGFRVVATPDDVGQ